MAFAGLNWTPAVFWNSTMAEFGAAIDGYEEKNSGGKPEPMTSERLRELMREYPDG